MREVKRIVACGMQGIGKTWETIRILFESAEGKKAIPATVDKPEQPAIPPRKCLIFDVNDEFGDFKFLENDHCKIRSLSMHDIVLFTVNNSFEVRRIRPIFDNGNEMTPDDKAKSLEFILKNFNNGILLVEDPNTYVSDNMPADIIGRLVSTRHRSTDVIIHFQNIGRAGNPKILGNTSMIRLHKTSDSVSRHKAKFEEKAELLQIAEAIVNTHFDMGDERFFVYVDIARSKIRGVFTYQEADDAVHKFISSNYRHIVAPVLLERDRKTGKTLYTTADAMEICRKNMLKKYFSFSFNKKL